MNNTYWKLNNDKGGIEIYFDDKPEQSILDKLKLNRFRWSRRNKCWYAKETPDRKELAIELTSDEKALEIINSSYKDVVKQDFERAEARIKYYEDKAKYLEEQSKEEHKKGAEIRSHIPFGQPILVGHHSEKGHRRAIKRLENSYDKANELSKKAEYYREKAEATRRYISEKKDPKVVERRIERFLKDKSFYIKTRDNIVNSKKDISVEKYNDIISNLDEKINYWKNYLNEIGYITILDIDEQTKITLKFKRSKISDSCGKTYAYKTEHNNKTYTVCENYANCWSVYLGDLDTVKITTPCLNKFKTLKKVKLWLQLYVNSLNS
ncbi:DUF3560 domain-containing protein [Dethiothermospora halolimnae]|uniref:DUF3560 domain-containing protein n=1 Tax=Dethiothermospora halolimnae TaxID=3114390 RepID=UPI003CCC3850